MNIVALLIQLVSGAVGGNLAGAMMKNFSLGPIGNSILGILGGGIGGQILHMIIAGGAGAAAPSGGLDLGSLVSNIAGGGIGGGLLMAIVGAIRSAMAKS